MLPSIRLLWRCSSLASETAAASLLSLIQAILRKNCNFSLETKKNKRLQKPTLGCLSESLIRKRFDFFETVSSIHLYLQFQLRSVREVCKDLNVVSVVILLSFQFLYAVILLLVSRPQEIRCCSCIVYFQRTVFSFVRF